MMFEVEIMMTSRRIRRQDVNRHCALMLIVTLTFQLDPMNGQIPMRSTLDSCRIDWRSLSGEHCSRQWQIRHNGGHFIEAAEDDFFLFLLFFPSSFSAATSRPKSAGAFVSGLLPTNG